MPRNTVSASVSWFATQRSPDVGWNASARGDANGARKFDPAGAPTRATDRVIPKPGTHASVDGTAPGTCALSSCLTRTPAGATKGATASSPGQAGFVSVSLRSASTTETKSFPSPPFSSAPAFALAFVVAFSVSAMEGSSAR